MAAAEKDRQQQAEAKGSGKGGRVEACILCLICWRSLVCREVRLSCLARRRLWECSPLLLRTIRGTPSCTPHHLATPQEQKTVCYQASQAGPVGLRAAQWVAALIQQPVTHYISFLSKKWAGCSSLDASEEGSTQRQPQS